MRINELKKIAKENDYIYLGTRCKYHDFIRDSDGALISINQFNVNDIRFFEIDWCLETDLKMIKAAIEFAETPPEDREEIKKYFYKHNSMKTKGGNPTYLAIRQRPSISYPVLQGSSEDIFEYKVEFTDEEIEEVKKEHGIFLDDFEKNEVKDDQK